MASLVEVYIEVDENLNPKEDAMKKFLQVHQDKVKGVLSGFDRLLCRGTLRFIAHVSGMRGYLCN